MKYLLFVLRKFIAFCCQKKAEVQSSKSRNEGSDVSSFRILVLDEEKVRPVGNSAWLWSVLSVSFSALTLLVDWHEGHLACENLHYISLLEQGEGRKKLMEEPANPGSS